jgi:hypothetical protein
MAVLILLIAPIVCANGKPGQLVPDPKRQAEIRRALVEHGYKPGKTWPETQEILREIARVHHWPHTHAPDAKTLIFLGLGNRYSDPSILDLPSSRIEGEIK